VALLVSRPVERIILFQLYLAVSAMFALLVGALQLQRRRLSQALAAARDEAQAATAAKAEFLANVSHELRTPLTAILGFSSVLSDEAGLSPSARRYADRITGASRALLTSINDLLDHARLEAIRIVRAPFQPLRQARAIMDVFEPAAEAKGLAVAVHGPDIPEWVMADGERLRQVLFNLISNAVKFTRRGGITVLVSYDAARSTLSYAVTDTGPGIEPQDAQRLFQRFTRFDGAGQGAGLGLAICKSVVEAMGGRIGMRPGQPGGSEFWFEVPAPRADAPDNSADGHERRNGLAGLRVLVAESHADSRDIVRALLEPLRVELTEAPDGVAACAHAAEAPFDVILMDLGLPRLDGPQAAMQIRSGGGPNQDTPIVAFSAANPGERLSAANSAAFDAYLEKPLSRESLQEALARWAC
jgi:signal transduction histidine kinase